MEKNNDIIIAILHLREVSSLLKYELPEISNLLLKLVNEMLNQYKIDNSDIFLAEEIVNLISS